MIITQKTLYFNDFKKEKKIFFINKFLQKIILIRTEHLKKHCYKIYKIAKKEVDFFSTSPKNLFFIIHKFFYNFLAKNTR